METKKCIEILKDQVELLSSDKFDMRSWLSITDNYLKRIFGDKTPKSRQLYSICDTLSVSLLGITDEDILQFKEQWITLLNGYIKELESFSIPTSEPKKTSNHLNVIVNQTQNQSQIQEQNQSIIVKLIFNALKEDLTGKQVKELESILSDPKISDKRPLLTEKLLSFGSNVVTGILGNILSNPQIMGF